MFYKRVWEFMKLTRPLFLAGGVILYALGVVIALYDGYSPNLTRLITGQILVTSIQLMTHYTNEYYDQEGDRLNNARTWFSGGSGVLSSGALSAQVARRSALALGGFAVLAMTAAGVQVPILFLLGALSLLAAWAYSAPPLALVSTGWGELSASLVVALMVPVVGYTMQSGGRLGLSLLVICLPLILLHFAMLVSFQIPDYPADQAIGKRTLAVRLGLQQAARLHNAAVLLAFCVIVGLALARWPGSQLAWLAFPLAVWQTFAIRHYTCAEPESYFGLTIGALSLFAGTTALWLAGYLLFGNVV